METEKIQQSGAQPTSGSQDQSSGKRSQLCLGSQAGRTSWHSVPKCSLPVAIYEAGIDVVRALDTADGLQADSRQLVRHDVHKAVLEFVAREVGTDET